ncbi:hypothetical protein PMKS-002978 [Pichia membranifaciens]|uniref:Zn(2)-C6 fungal-type domain-containing protein n=1 Tax=Pichia membranifaciens TaxID=4926 RepID=A0A1Q2YIU4_9ASCO|nr:hypothetical protein PMKS-002978 [Pichia membranifaciens]
MSIEGGENKRTSVIDDNTVSKSGGVDKSKLKRTNRIIRSCSRCKKRKVKCNFEIPCDRCIARNQAHLCTRDPIIFDGLLISNDDTTELKYSQENEVLKRKIKELQDTIVKLKSVKNEQPLKFDNKSAGGSADVQVITSSSVSSSNGKLSLNDVVLKPKNNTQPLHQEHNSSKFNDTDWNTYSTTIGLLKKGLANGLILDSTNSSASEMDYNTEEWLRLNDKNFLKYDAEDSKSKCWLYELDLITELKKPTCDTLVKSGLKIVTLFPIIDVSDFIREYEGYWADDSIAEKHISAMYTKSALNYLFVSLMYALMCFGVYQCDAEVSKQLNFSSYDWDNYSKAFFSASLEALYRGRYMTHPNFKSIQILSILRILCGFLGGNTLSNNLTCVTFFLSYKLDIMKSDDPLKHVSMWNTLAYDWYDDHDRYLLSDLDYANSLPRINRWIDEDQELINWPQYFLLFLVNVSIIKRRFYHDSVKLTLKSLKLADIELRYLKVESSRDLDSYSPQSYKNFTRESIRCLNFHINSLIHHEILEVNLKLSTFLSCEEWSSNYYSICYLSSCEIIKAFISEDIPLEYKSYPSICEHVIYASVFLIVDCMLDVHHMKNYKEILKLVTQTLPIFQSFRSMVTGAIRGLYTIEKLLILMNLKRKDRPKVTGTAISSTNKGQENYKVKTHLNEEGSTNEHARKNSTEVETKDVKPETSDLDSSAEESSSSDDSDMPLYTSTLENKQKQSFLSMLAQQNSVSHNFQDGDNNKEQIHNFNSYDVHRNQNNMSNADFGANSRDSLLMNVNGTSTTPGCSPNNLNSTTPQPGIESPASNKTNPQPLIQNTIMDILEDSGWIQFINSIEDLGGT